MPRARKQPPELDPGTVYVCWQTGAALVEGTEVVFREGDRLPGDHPIVQTCWYYFLPDGHTPADVASRYQEVFPEPEVHPEPYERVKPPPPLRDEDAVVAIRPIGGGLALNQQAVPPGTKLPEDADVVKKNPDCFVDVVPPGLTRDDAVVARQTITFNDVPYVYRGQWIHKNDPEVQRMPVWFELPGLEGTTLEQSRHAPKKKE